MKVDLRHNLQINETVHNRRLAYSPQITFFRFGCGVSADHACRVVLTPLNYLAQLKDSCCKRRQDKAVVFATTLVRTLHPVMPG